MGCRYLLCQVLTCLIFSLEAAHSEGMCAVILIHQYGKEVEKS